MNTNVAAAAFFEIFLDDIAACCCKFAHVFECGSWRTWYMLRSAHIDSLYICMCLHIHMHVSMCTSLNRREAKSGRHYFLRGTDYANVLQSEKSSRWMTGYLSLYVYCHVRVFAQPQSDQVTFYMYAVP